MKKRVFEVASEAELCRHFLAALPDGWTPYPETGGWDILLVRQEDGFQIGIQAKLALNAKVLDQALERRWWRDTGPDCRAVLVPEGRTGSLGNVARALGITVIVVGGFDRGVKCHPAPHKPGFCPRLPELRPRFSGPPEEWHECVPASRLPLPEYVPDVAAGVAAPVQLTLWKIKAIKLSILLERRGYVTRADFRALDIDPRLWLARQWLQHDGDGRLVYGALPPDFKEMHPENWRQIEADFGVWGAPLLAAPAPAPSSRR